MPVILTASLVPGERRVKATVISREAGVLCGTAWFDECVRRCDPTAKVTWQGADGDRIAANQLLCEIEGNGRALLTAERSALNFLQLLSAVASKVRIYADAIAGTRAQVVDTRKTLPGLRIAQKYAVRAGGGGNHRLALWDAILIKENHIHAAGGIAQAMAAAKRVAEASEGSLQVHPDRGRKPRRTEPGLNAGATMILLDNFSLDMMREASRINAGAPFSKPPATSRWKPSAASPKPVSTAFRWAPDQDVKALDLSMRFVA